ncbi:type II toxin-antitoxin system VapB family antitoxin [Mycobacterium sp.]|uniref:type II toxin-antitoxin system VapB family antitoxin n=1 Tax=Mycobacterium sp. TaxID=1785 RepID=UPI0031CE35FE
MARTVVDIDDEALAAAAKVLKTTTKKDTVNGALRHRRAHHDNWSLVSARVTSENGLLPHHH